MATFTAFFGSLRPGWPGTHDGGVSYFYPIYADMILMNSSGYVLDWGSQTSGFSGFLTVTSTDGIVPGDTVTTLRAKIMANVRVQYPQIQASDTIKAVWLDSGGLLSL